MKPKIIKLNHDERIVAVVPERCSGAGWSNTPTWVFIATRDGKLREEGIQPEDRTPELNALFGPGEAMCAALSAAIPVKRKSRGR